MPDGEEYGEERLAAAKLAAHRHKSGAALHASIMDEVRGFAVGFEDDATLLAVAVR